MFKLSVFEIYFHVNLLFFPSAKSKYEKNPERLKTVSSPWPPWRIPKETTPFYKDPRRFLHSRKSKQMLNHEYLGQGFHSLWDLTHTSIAI